MTIRRYVLVAARSVALVSLACVPCGSLRAAGTAITIDSSWGRTPAAMTPAAIGASFVGNGGAQHSVPGATYVIPQALGRLAGNNLFHSFGTFSVGAGDAAVFTTSTQSLQNVISRVTGATPSQINGLLALLPASGSAPNFFLINPAGVTFGAGAQVDVPAAFHVSTANDLRFGDGTLFKAGTGADSALTIAAPAAFGFLGTTRAAVTVAGNGGTVLATSQHPLSFIAGDVRIERALVGTIDGGDLRVAAVGQKAVDVPLTGALPPGYGNLDVVNGGALLTVTFGEADGGNIAVSAGNVTVAAQTPGSFANILTSAYQGSTGNAGRISIAATGRLSVAQGSISSEVDSIGNAGTIAIEAGSIALDDGLIQTYSYFGGGDLSVTSRGSLSLANGSIIRTVTLGSGDSGMVTISADGAFSLLSGSQVATFNQNLGYGGGNAGAIRLEADSILIDGAGSSGNTAIFSETDFLTSGSAGAIKLSARGDLTIRNGGTVVSLTGSFGDGGAVEVSAGGTLTLLSGAEITTYNVNLFAGKAGPITVSAPTIVIDGTDTAKDTGISSQANPDSLGGAGEIHISAPRSLSVVNGGLIVSSTASVGDGGAVTVEAGEVTVDGRHNEFFTGISTSTSPESSGHAGPVTVTASGNLSVLDGALISSESYGTGDGGAVTVTARNITLDGKGNSIAVDSQGGSALTGISVDAEQLGTAATTGAVTVTARGSLSVADLAAVRSRTSGDGGSGPVLVTSGGSVSIDGGRILSTTFGNGNAGDIAITAGGNVSLVNDGQIGGVTFGSGNGGGLAITAAQDLLVLEGGKIFSGTLEGVSGDAGPIKIVARNLTMDSRGIRGPETFISSISGGSRGKSGDVDIRLTGDLSMAGAQIGSRTVSGGDAANVKIHARNVTLDGRGDVFTGVFADSQHGDAGKAGDIELRALGDLTLLNGASVSASTFSTGNAGAIKVDAASITLDGRGSEHFTGIGSDSEPGATGDAGRVEVSARRGISVLNRAAISSDTSSRGQAGDVVVSTQGRILLYNGGTISSNTDDAGDAGSVSVSAGSMDIDGHRIVGANTGILAGAGLGSSGRAGDVAVAVTGHLSVVDGGAIASTTNSSGDAGSVRVSAGSILLDGRGVILDGRGGQTTAIASAASFGTGNGGNVVVSAKGALVLRDGALISASADQDTGAAGSVRVNAGSIEIFGRAGGRINTGIVSFTGPGASGSGDVTVIAERQLSIYSSGIISAATYSAVGRSGAVNVEAGSILVDGKFSTITAAANAGSSGQTGTVTVTAAKSLTLSNGGSLSIRNDANVRNPASLTPTLLSVKAADITLRNAQITTQATGNVSASDILIQFSGQMLVDPSGITTSAFQGNGGSIRVLGGNLLRLDGSQITTSVKGAIGNGGDIAIQANTLLMNTGFIQANTAASGASGGNVSINVQTLVASGGILVIGGSTPLAFQPGAFGLNVIQAAAPEGLSGNVRVTSPALDVTGKIAALSAPEIDLGALGKDLCRTGWGSSLTPLARGGMRPVAAALIRPEGAPALMAMHPDLPKLEVAAWHARVVAANDCR